MLYKVDACYNTFALLSFQYTEPGEVQEQNSYVGLGNVTPLDLISFAYQISSGMVGQKMDILILSQ